MIPTFLLTLLLYSAPIPTVWIAPPESTAAPWAQRWFDGALVGDFTTTTYGLASGRAEERHPLLRWGNKHQVWFALAHAGGKYLLRRGVKSARSTKFTVAMAAAFTFVTIYNAKELAK